MEIQANEKKQREKLAELKEKYCGHVFAPSVMMNEEWLNHSRIISNIFIGMSAGIMGLGLFNGVAWWALMGLITSALLAIRIGMLGTNDNGSAKYFSSTLESAFGGTLSNFAIFSLFWIMFYNIVYVV